MKQLFGGTTILGYLTLADQVVLARVYIAQAPSLGILNKMTVKKNLLVKSLGSQDKARS